jgi:hypothetical protein
LVIEGRNYPESIGPGAGCPTQHGPAVDSQGAAEEYAAPVVGNDELDAKETREVCA